MNRPRATPRRPISSVVLAVAVLAAGLAACDAGDGTTLRTPTAPTTLPPPPTIDPLLTDPLSSSPFGEVLDDPGLVQPDLQLFTPWADGAAIDARYTCDGQGLSPAISWSGLDPDTVEVAVSMVDESNLSNGRPFVHWVIAGLDPSIGRLDEGEVPAGAVQGINFFGDVGYTGPCPDPGTTGNFTLTVFALNQQVELADGTPAAQLLDLIGAVSVATASSTGTVTR